jgi:hypothetical protein
MAGAIEKIEKELGGIREALGDLGKEFNVTYENYLTALGEAVGQQLILASYHLCTQKEPERFLKLSFSSRQKMQQEMRALTKKTTEKLQELLKQEREKKQSTGGLLSILNLTKEGEPNINLATKKTEAQTNSINIDPSQLFAAKLNYPLPSGLQGEIKAEEAREEEPEEEEEKVEKTIESPEDLASWQHKIESSIPKILKNLSQNSNILLQKAGILPKKLPPQVLEAASQIESNDAPVTGTPNLLNLLIETEEGESEEKSAEVTKVTAIHLRLSEIEFADARLTAWRKEIRKLSERLKQLQRAYKKKQRELAVIEAESAWRASWYDE